MAVDLGPLGFDFAGDEIRRLVPGGDTPPASPDRMIPHRAQHSVALATAEKERRAKMRPLMPGFLKAIPKMLLSYYAEGRQSIAAVKTGKSKQWTAQLPPKTEEESDGEESPDKSYDVTGITAFKFTTEIRNGQIGLKYEVRWVLKNAITWEPLKCLDRSHDFVWRMWDSFLTACCNGRAELFRRFPPRRRTPKHFDDRIITDFGALLVERGYALPASEQQKLCFDIAPGISDEEDSVESVAVSEKYKEDPRESQLGSVASSHELVTFEGINVQPRSPIARGAKRRPIKSTKIVPNSSPSAPKRSKKTRPKVLPTNPSPQPSTSRAHVESLSDARTTLRHFREEFEKDDKRAGGPPLNSNPLDQSFDQKVDDPVAGKMEGGKLVVVLGDMEEEDWIEEGERIDGDEEEEDVEEAGGAEEEEDDGAGGDDDDDGGAEEEAGGAEEDDGGAEEDEAGGDDDDEDVSIDPREIVRVGQEEVLPGWGNKKARTSEWVAGLQPNAQKPKPSPIVVVLDGRRTCPRCEQKYQLKSFNKHVRDCERICAKKAQPAIYHCSIKECKKLYHTRKEKNQCEDSHTILCSCGDKIKVTTKRRKTHKDHKIVKLLS